MSQLATFTIPYAAFPTFTPLFTITASNTPTNVLVKVFAIVDDITSSVIIAADQSYTLVWDGTAFTSVTPYAGVASLAFKFTISGAVATFGITPGIGSPAANASLDVTVLPNNYQIVLDY